MTQAYKDVSIFQNWKQWADVSGQEWKSENKGMGCFSVYKMTEDAFVHVGVIRTSKNAGCKKIQDTYLSAE